MSVFRFVLLTLACFRVTRFVTTDTFPPMRATRDWLQAKLPGSWADLVTCNYCSGLYVIATIYAIDHYLFRIPTVLLAAVATMAVVGFIGNWDD